MVNLRGIRNGHRMEDCGDVGTALRFADGDHLKYEVECGRR